MNFYYLRKKLVPPLYDYGNEITCVLCTNNPKSEKEFLKFIDFYHEWNSDRRYIPIPLSCVIKVYGKDGLPSDTNSTGRPWLLPWPEKTVQ
jgi:hypothetical protein